MDELINCLKPLVSISKMFGFLPFNLQSDGTLKFSRIIFFYSVISVVVSKVFAVLKMIHMDEYRMEGSFISKISFVLANLMSIAFTIISIIMNLIHVDILEAITKTLWAFDNEV